jgi:hypothetical protein
LKQKKHKIAEKRKKMFCTKCGNELPVNAKFCTKCGTKVEAFQPGAIQPNPTPQRASVPQQEPTQQQTPVRQASPAPQPQQKKNEKVTKTKNSKKVSNKNKNETEKKSGSGAMVYLLIGAAVLIIILIAIIVLLFIKGNQPAKQDDITDKPVVTTEQTTETEMSTEQTDRKDVSGQQEASEKTSEVINKEDTTGNEDMGTDGAVGEEEAEYILPESASRLLTEADLENLTQEDLRIARNEIYARHGRKFLDEGLQEYFNGKSWYNGTIEPDDFKEDMLSEIERTNEDTIVNYETKMGYR